MKLKIKKTVEITSIDLWKHYAPPMDGETQWKDGRSAMSLAQFMLDKNQIKKLEAKFSSLGYNVRGEVLCTPEANTPLPGKGNGRNHDLLMIGNDFVAGIESKVTEPFGNTIGKEVSKASANKQLRIDTLVKELFNCEISEDIEDLRYQLLTGAVGTLFEAIRNNKCKALFLVIVFTDSITAADEKQISKNNQDFADFCKFLDLKECGGTKKVLNIDLTISKMEISLNENNASL